MEKITSCGFIDPKLSTYHQIEQIYQNFYDSQINLVHQYNYENICDTCYLTTSYQTYFKKMLSQIYPNFHNSIKFSTTKTNKTQLNNIFPFDLSTSMSSVFTKSPMDFDVFNECRVTLIDFKNIENLELSVRFSFGQFDSTEFFEVSISYNAYSTSLTNESKFFDEFRLIQTKLEKVEFTFEIDDEIEAKKNDTEKLKLYSNDEISVLYDIMVSIFRQI